MKTFEANSVTETEIILKNSEDLESVAESINEEENFILQWSEDGVKKSQLMIGNNLTPKLKNGDLKLTAIEGGTKNG